jgi:hypothetical protein
VLHSNLCGVGGVLDGLFALCGAGAWGYAAGILQTAVDSNGNLRNEYESSGEVNTANQELQQALNALSASSMSTVVFDCRDGLLLCITLTTLATFSLVVS